MATLERVVKRFTTAEKNVTRFLLVLVVLTVFTWAVGTLDIQFRSEKQIGFTDGFPGSTSLWTIDGDRASVSIDHSGIALYRQSENATNTFRSFPLKSEQLRVNKYIRVRGVIETINEAESLPLGAEAGFMIWYMDSEEHRFAYSTVQRLTGHHKLYHAEHIVRIPANADAFSVGLVSRKSNGHFKLVDASATLVSDTLLYKIIRPTVFFIWALSLLVVGLWLFRQGDYLLSASLTVLLGGTLIGILLPSTITTEVIEPAYDALLSLVAIENKKSLAAVYKFGHFAFFFLIALLLFIRGKGIGLTSLTTFQYLLLFVIATEGLQLFLFNRNTRIFDMGIDLAGVLLAWLIAQLWGSRKNFREDAGHR